MQTNYPDKQDGELLGLYRTTGNNEFLGALLQRYTGLLLGVCMKYLRDKEQAKDAVQQVFVKAISELQKYEVQYFKSWLYMVAKNHCLMKLRERKVYMREVDEATDSTEMSGFEAKQAAAEKETALLDLAAAIRQLGPEQALCISLFYLQKKSYHEICAETGLSAMQVKSSIQNGKRNLKIALEKKSDRDA